MSNRHCFALVAVVLFALAAACSSIDVPVAQQSGAELFTSQGCNRCHSSNGSGSFFGLGPDLRDKRADWSEDSLARYLADPAAFAAQDDRLGKREMASFGHLDEASRRRLATHVLSLMDVER